MTETHRGPYLSHRDAEMLHDVLVDWCSDRGLSLECAAAQSTAKELAELFEIGMREDVNLRDAVASK